MLQIVSKEKLDKDDKEGQNHITGQDRTGQDRTLDLCDVVSFIDQKMI